MFRRRKSVGDRIRDFLPVVLLMAVGAVSVTVAMNILVTVTPVVIGGRPTPSPTPVPKVLPTIPSFAIITEPPEVTVMPSVTLPPMKPTIITKRLAEHDPNGVWDLSVAYPQFLSTSTPWAAEMNDTIGSFWRSLADQFESGPAVDRQRAGKVNRLTGTFTNEYLTPNLASFTLNWTDDTVPDNVLMGVANLNFDLGTGQPLVFDDLFADPDAALQILSTQTSDLLYYQLAASWDETTVRLGTTPTPGNFSNWEVTAGGMRITFNQFQVIATNVTPSVVVPWSALVPVLRPSGPVAALAGVAPLPEASLSPSPTAQPSPSPQTGS